MNAQMAYLLGMITGNGEIQRGNTETTFSIEIPHKKLLTEANDDVTVWVAASMMNIQQSLQGLLGTSLNFTQDNKCSYVSFTKSNEDYLVRELVRYVGAATSSHNVRISPEVFDFSYDERKEFIKGFADVTGYIRRTNAMFEEPNHRVYFEVPGNWYLVIDFCNLLRSVDVPVQNIDWGHPNMRDSQHKKYDKGKKEQLLSYMNFWKKEHQIKVWAVEYQPIGFNIRHKQDALDKFAEEQKAPFIEAGKDYSKTTHKYYWEVTARSRGKALHHPGQNDESLPEEIRGKHYNSWRQIAKDLGYSERKGWKKKNSTNQ